MATQTTQDKVLAQYAAKIDAHMEELFILVEYRKFDTKKLGLQERDKETLSQNFDSFYKKCTRIYKKLMKFK